MDFKSLISKIESIDGKIETPAAPVLPKAVQLNEDAELRVLAGTSSYITEAKKKAEEKVKEDNMKVGDKKTSSTGGTIEKTATGVKHTAGKNYGGDKAPEVDDDEPKAKKKAKKESIDPEAFKEKFSKMVEAKKAKPDFLDVDKDGNKKEPMKKALKDKKEGKVAEGKKSYSAKSAAAGKDIGKPGKNFEKIAKKAGKEYGSKEKGEKVAGAVLKKLRAKEGVETSKAMVAESVETKLALKDMLRIVKESGGQQAIDPMDKALWTWANRVASSKITEGGERAEIFAAMVYERNGGSFEMYDVLAEDTK